MSALPRVKLRSDQAELLQVQYTDPPPRTGLTSDCLNRQILISPWQLIHQLINY